jgi:hypothetical protein
MAIQDKYSTQTGNTVQGVSIDSTRRLLNFGERIAKLAPQQSPFFVYLSKMARKVTDDPIFKFLEQRHQWQRRTFTVDNTVTGAGWDAGAETDGTSYSAGNGDLYISCKYDKYGNITTTDNPCYFIVPGQVIAIANDDGNVRRFRISDTATVTTVTTDYTNEDNNGAYVSHLEHSNDLSTVITAESLTPVGSDIGAAEAFAAGNKGTVIGSAWAEGTTAPDGWEDALYDREGYCQIFKTGMKLFSGTAMATRYRGIADEFKRVWAEKLMEHKMDIEQAVLFGSGKGHSVSAGVEGTGAPVRYTWGILPYTEANGKQYNFNYSSSGYDSFLSSMEDFFAPESGNSGSKLVLTSRKIITFLNKLGSGGFLNNTVGSSQYRLDVQNIQNQFGHTVTKVNTLYGDLHFVMEPLLRGPWENKAVAVDMKNVAWRPLVGNGVNRDTHIMTNIQGNDEDGRRDMILTEAGLEISLPETHAILSFS